MYTLGKQIDVFVDCNNIMHAVSSGTALDSISSQYKNMPTESLGQVSELHAASRRKK